MCEIWPINLTVMHLSFMSSTLCSLFALCFHGSAVYQKFGLFHNSIIHVHKSGIYSILR